VRPSSPPSPRTRSPNRGNEDRLGGQIFLAEDTALRIRDGGNTIVLVVREAILPSLTTGENLDRVGPVTIREDRTKPPARYSEGSLIQEMERVGLDEVHPARNHQELYDRKFIEGSIRTLRRAAGR